MDEFSNTEPLRKLASIQKVENIIKHGNADSLDLVTVLGWQVVIKSGEVKEGDKVIYCEIDSLLPDAEWVPKLIREKKMFRIRTIKLRGEMSQGLVLKCFENMADYEIGKDVTSELQITKYERGEVKGTSERGEGGFPTHLLSKTDEPRIQSSPILLKQISEKDYYITEKLDGTSATYLINGDKFLVCSRNLVRDNDDSVYWQIAKKYNIEEKLRKYPHLAIQGEICGPNIQKNLLGLKEIDYFIFNIVNISDRSKLKLSDFLETCKKLELKHVPIEEIGDKFPYKSIPELLLKAEGKYKNTKNEREGLVIRTQNQNLSFKVISNKYLLKYE